MYKLPDSKLKKMYKGGTSEANIIFLPQALEIKNSWDLLKPVSMSFYKKFHPMAWLLACNMSGVYQIITEELVDFVKHLTNGKKTIEVCAGYGTLGRSLGIPITDRKLHLDPRAKLEFEIRTNEINQLPDYPDDVIEMTANKAHREYKPDWVVGSWITQKLLPGNKHGMMYGAEEEKFIESSNYLHIGSGHLAVHQNKRIMKVPHILVEADWIIDKTSYKSTSQMRIWSKEPICFDDFPEHLEFDYVG